MVFAAIPSDHIPSKRYLHCVMNQIINLLIDLKKKI